MACKTLLRSIVTMSTCFALLASCARGDDADQRPWLVLSRAKLAQGSVVEETVINIESDGSFSGNTETSSLDGELSEQDFRRLQAILAEEYWENYREQALPKTAVSQLTEGVWLHAIVSDEVTDTRELSVYFTPDQQLEMEPQILVDWMPELLDMIEEQFSN